MKKYKQIKEKTDLYIEFTEEEKKELGWKDNQKFSWELIENGGICLKPYVSVDIDMSSYPREILEFLVSESCNRDISVNEVIQEILEKKLTNNCL
jgi:hypothetical protein